MNWVKKVSSDYDSYNSFAKDISFSFYIGDNFNYGNGDTNSDDDGDGVPLDRVPAWLWSKSKWVGEPD